MLGHKRLSLYSFHESHSAEANSGFCSMKQLVVLISSPPPFTPSPWWDAIFSGFPKVHQYLNTLLAKDKRETVKTMKVKCLTPKIQQNNITGVKPKPLGPEPSLKP